MPEKYNKQMFFDMCSSGDYNQVVAYLDKATGHKRLASKLKTIFKGGKYVLKSKNPEVAEFLCVYEDYLKWALLNCVTTDQCKEYLLEKFPHLLSDVTDIDNWDDLEGKVSEFFDKRGYFALFGITAPYPDLHLWKRQTVRKTSVELPNGAITIDVCAMKGIITRGWLSYLSLNKIGTGGWVTLTGTNYFAKSYNTFSQDFKISLLKHEAQHFYDQQHYPEMESADLEYRAKLVELSYLVKPHILLFSFFGAMGDSSDNDRKTNPHGNANRRIVQAMSQRLFNKEFETNRKLWKVRKREIGFTARELLDDSNASLMI